MSLPEVSFADSAWVSLSPRMAPPGGGAGVEETPGASLQPDAVASVLALRGRCPCARAPALQPKPGPRLQRRPAGQDGTPSLPLPQ